MILIQAESKSAKLQTTQLQKADPGRPVPKNLIFNVYSFPVFYYYYYFPLQQCFGIFITRIKISNSVGFLIITKRNLTKQTAMSVITKTHHNSDECYFFKDRFENSIPSHRYVKKYITNQTRSSKLARTE